MFQPLQAAIPVDAKFPHPLECLFEPRRYKILWGGRGASRSWSVARALLILGSKRAIRVLCVRELQKSIEDSCHQLLADQITALGLDSFYRVTKTAIIGVNGTSFAFEGIKNNTNKIKSYEGIDYCWVEEAIKVSRHSWGVLIPTIRKEESEIWMTFNPELEEDYTYSRFAQDPELRQTAHGSSGWTRWDSSYSISVKMTGEDNPWFPQVLREERDRDKAKDQDYYLNVWCGHTISHLEGAVYAKELRKAREANRICTVPYEPTIPVDVFFDLGRADNTAAWFAQRVAMQYRILAYYEDSGEDWPYHLREVQSRQYVIGTIHLPHDAKAKRLGNPRTIEKMTRDAGFRVAIVPSLSLTDGINAARVVFANCWFDKEECSDGIKALSHYRYRVVDGRLTNEPLHDWASDGADAFRYLALSIKSHATTGTTGVVSALKAAHEAWKRGREKNEFPSDNSWMAH